MAISKFSLNYSLMTDVSSPHPLPPPLPPPAAHPHLLLKQDPVCVCEGQRSSRKWLRGARQFAEATLFRATQLFQPSVDTLWFSILLRHVQALTKALSHTCARIRWVEAQTPGTWPLGPVTHSQVLTFDCVVVWSRWGAVCACCACESRRKNANDFFSSHYLKAHFDNVVLVQYVWKIKLSFELMHLFLLLLLRVRRIFSSSQAPHWFPTRDHRVRILISYGAHRQTLAWSRPGPARLFSRIMWETMRQSATSKFLLPSTLFLVGTQDKERSMQGSVSHSKESCHTEPWAAELYHADHKFVL